jgi:peptidoglycan/LPS O-acetylase OafA/YrhL
MFDALGFGIACTLMGVCIALPVAWLMVRWLDSPRRRWNRRAH